MCVLYIPFPCYLPIGFICRSFGVPYELIEKLGLGPCPTYENFYQVTYIYIRTWLRTSKLYTNIIHRHVPSETPTIDRLSLWLTSDARFFFFPYYSWWLRGYNFNLNMTNREKRETSEKQVAHASTRLPGLPPCRVCIEPRELVPRGVYLKPCAHAHVALHSLFHRGGITHTVRSHFHRVNNRRYHSADPFSCRGRGGGLHVG